MKIAYTCKFCQRQGIAKTDCTDEEMAMIGANIEAWKAMLACDRCADFHNKQIIVVNRMQKLSARLQIARRCGNNKEAQDAEGYARTGFENLTKRYVYLLVEYFNRNVGWEPEMVNLIMDKPDRMGMILAGVFNMVKTGDWKEAKERRAA